MIKNKANIIIIVLITIILVICIALISLIRKDHTVDMYERDINIKSKILKEIIKNNWSSDYNFGTKESTFDEYDIYFDEGMEVKVINDKIYNIVFTEKYKNNIVSNVKSDDSLEDIIEKLGQPDFGGRSINLIGYKYEDIYVFFNGKQASIYVNNMTDKTDISVFIEKYDSNIDFINSLTDTWNDYDLYTIEENDNGLQYVVVDYPNKGVRINCINEEMTITAYNNCNIKIPENDIYTITTKNKNLIYEVETERQNSIHNREYAYEQFNASINNVPPDFEEIDQENQEFKVVQSKKFISVQKSFNSKGEYKLYFVSIDGELPNSELDSYITSNIWVDDYNVAYGIKDKGLYLYNVKTRESIILKEGIGNFSIIGLTKENKLKYDDTQIDVKI